ncbi:MAG: ferredoxin--NADP reductase [Chitinophagales bacterium]
MSRLHELKIKKIKSETPYAKVVTFDIPEDLKSDFKYIPGQYITVEVEVDGKKERRAYSLCSSPVMDDDLSVGVKKVEMGKVSGYINDEAKEGESIRVMPPMGNFTVNTDSTRKKHYVLLGGGSGITPLMSIIRTVLVQEPNSRVTLFYANRDEESIMFKSVLDELENKYPERLEIFHSLDRTTVDWVINKGYLTRDILQTLLKNKLPAAPQDFDYYICGPTPLMSIIDEALEALQIPEKQIHKEFFTAKLKTEEKKEEREVSDSPLDSAEIHLTVDGEDYDFEYKGEDSLLEAALDNDIDAPYACQVGACCTCRAKVFEGKVVMADRESLSDEEIDEGYVLTCQSKPLTPKVIYTYDE